MVRRLDVGIQLFFVSGSRDNTSDGRIVEAPMQILELKT
jgi:hypothetical protein